jgi:hypothetical protein
METTMELSKAAVVENLANGHRMAPVIVLGAATAFTLPAGVGGSGDIVLASADNAVVTLPKASTCQGQMVTVVNAANDGDALIDIEPNADDAIIGTVAAVSSGGALDKRWRNTKLTANKGDYTTLVSNGGTAWYIIGGVGVWASET